MEWCLDWGQYYHNRIMQLGDETIQSAIARFIEPGGGGFGSNIPNVMMNQYIRRVDNVFRQTGPVNKTALLCRYVVPRQDEIIAFKLLTHKSRATFFRRLDQIHDEIWKRSRS